MHPTCAYTCNRPDLSFHHQLKDSQLTFVQYEIEVETWKQEMDKIYENSTYIRTSPKVRIKTMLVSGLHDELSLFIPVMNVFSLMNLFSVKLKWNHDVDFLNFTSYYC